MRGERGAALLLAAMALLMAGLTLAMDALLIYGKRVREDKQAVTALSEAKRSLLAYAVIQQPTDRRLPCPFVGSADAYGQAATAPNSCGADNTMAAIGLLPWTTLQRLPLLDDTRAPIWYVVSGDFKRGVDPPDEPPDCSALNNKLTINNGDVYYAAILFAPGKPITGVVPAIVRNTALPVVRSDYLELENAASNLSGSVVNFVTQGNNFNDRLLGIKCVEQAFH